MNDTNKKVYILTLKCRFYLLFIGGDKIDSISCVLQDKLS